MPSPVNFIGEDCVGLCFGASHSLFFCLILTVKDKPAKTTLPKLSTINKHGVTLDFCFSKPTIRKTILGFVFVPLNADWVWRKFRTLWWGVVRNSGWMEISDRNLWPALALEETKLAERNGLSNRGFILARSCFALLKWALKLA